MIALLAATVLRLQSIAEVEALTRRDEYVAALAVAERLVDPDERARAEVDVRYRAGDLFGARRRALDAIDGGCLDAVLALRAAELCTTLRDARGARAALAALERALAASPPSAGRRAEWDALLERRRKALLELEERDHDGARSLARARWVAGSFLAALGAGALLLSRWNDAQRLRRDPGSPIP